MALPRKLKNFILFVGADSYAGEVKTVTPPKLTRKMEDHQGGGMLGPVKVDVGMEALELAYTAAGMVHDQVKNFGKTTVDGLMLRFAGAMQRDDTGAVDAVEITVRGRYSEIDFGDQTAGSLNETKVTVPCSYYKLTVNGIILAEIDLVNMIETINGDDKLAAVRTALGIASLGLGLSL